ncbi:MAG: Gfo/Idh/MocA family oxidoreductase [Phycisphaerae bacterium]
MTRLLRTAVIGVGHMGRHHARIYRDLPDVELVGICDLDPKRAEDTARQVGAPALTDAADLLGKVDAVTIAVPTVRHPEVSRPFIQSGVATLIEKPIAPDRESAAEMLRWAQESNSIISVGHSERFNPVVLAMGRMNVEPKFIETQRVSPFTFRSADIGVVFDMMIHDIDIVLHLVKSRQYKVHAVGVSVLGPHEDVANARIAFDNGCVANLTASRLALKTERRIRVFSPDAYLTMDYRNKTGLAVKKNANLDLIKMARERNFEDLSQMSGLDFGKMLKVEPLVVDDVEPLRCEIESFLSAVRTSQQPAVTGQDGLAAVQLAEDIVKSIQTHEWQLAPDQTEM